MPLALLQLLLLQACRGSILPTELRMASDSPPVSWSSVFISTPLLLSLLLRQLLPGSLSVVTTHTCIEPADGKGPAI